MEGSLIVKRKPLCYLQYLWFMKQSFLKDVVVWVYIWQRLLHKEHQCAF